MNAPQRLGIIGLAGAAVVAFLWIGEGKMPDGPNLTLDSVFDPETFNAYAWWKSHSNGAAYVHHYPERLAPNCLPQPLANEVGAISTTLAEIAVAGHADHAVTGGY